MAPVCRVVLTFLARRPSWVFGIDLQGSASIACMLVTLLTSADYATVGSVWCFCTVVGVLWGDWGLSATGEFLRTWGMVVVVMDLALVLNLPAAVQLGIVAIMMTYQSAQAVQSAVDWGFWHAARSIAEGNPAYVPCDCPDPPCQLAPAYAVMGLFSVGFIFIADYLITRNFANKARAQLREIQSAVCVAERVAALLAAYSVDSAQEAVDVEGVLLPPALRTALVQLLRNLASYRPYIPESLLIARNLGDTESQSSEWVRGATSPSEREFVTMCFTDIERSTDLWEAHPQGMFSGLQLHNAVLRSIAAQTGGYEVKTIGDSFMLAFPDAVSACSFALAAQEGLLTAEWPEDLVQHPLCAPTASADGELLWHGLRVRMGIHCGDARVQLNPVTGRKDFFGPTVNTAARVESELRKGGLIGVTDAVLEAVGTDGLRALGWPHVASIGLRKLRGIQKGVAISVLTPAALAQRIDVLTASEHRGGTPLPSRRKPRASETLGERAQSLSSSRSTLQQSPSSSSGGTRLSRLSRGSPSNPLWFGLVCNSPKPSSPAIVQGDAASLPLRLAHGKIACAVARLDLCHTERVREQLSQFLAAVEAAADTSQGMVQNVLSACAVVAWNAALPCSQAAAGCQQFLYAVHSDGFLRGSSRFGVASGHALSGHVATARSRFVTIVGGCVELAAALAEEAEIRGYFALAAGAVAMHCQRAGWATRAQQWQAAHAAAHYDVYSVTPQGANKWGLLEVADTLESVSACPGETVMPTPAESAKEDDPTLSPARIRVVPRVWDAADAAEAFSPKAAERHQAFAPRPSVRSPPLSD
eukprot:TRINITY_DN2421_c0_g2_i1.p1 TRINITY_DN2421_c0_g2~~TRINITY_DN2421_c0_g2_i1.p1  ORF type:complete len:898 (+),score=247.39 TRINITY_DN2421_c0_g2_i1:246-2696(+)